MKNKTRYVTDWKGEKQLRPTVKGKVCLELEDMDITLIQQPNKLLAVVYGLHAKTNMNYPESCTHLGSCILHALTSDSKIKSED